MRTRRLVHALMLPAAMLASSGQPAAPPSARVTTVLLARRASTTSGRAISMPQGRLEAVATRYVIPRGAVLPPHMHPSPRFAFVVSGTLAVTNMRTNATRTFHPGELVAEDVGVWHRARNAGAGTVELLVLDLGPPGRSNVVTKGQPAG